jgi:hypothetical protein
MRNLSKDLAERLRVECRAIGRDALECQLALIQSRFQASQQRGDVVMVRIVIEHLIQQALVLPIVDDGKHTGRSLIEFIGRHITRKRLKRPVQKRTAHLPWRLFSPQPLSNSAGWQRAQTRGDHATGASWRVGKASHLRPPDAPPSASPDGWSDHRAALHRSDRCCSAYGTASSSETSMSPAGQPDIRWIHRQGRVRCAARMCGDRQDGHIVGRGCGRGYGCTPLVKALGGP